MEWGGGQVPVFLLTYGTEIGPERDDSGPPQPPPLDRSHPPSSRYKPGRSPYPRPSPPVPPPPFSAAPGVRGRGPPVLRGADPQEGRRGRPHPRRPRHVRPPRQGRASGVTPGLPCNSADAWQLSASKQLPTFQVFPALKYLPVGSPHLKIHPTKKPDQIECQVRSPAHNSRKL